jgi:hypothetical protein
VAVCRNYGTTVFGSAAVGFGDYPTITSLRFESDDYRKMIAVVAWHDPISSDIKFRFVWVDPTPGSPSPVTVQAEVLANEYKSYPSGRPAVAMLHKSMVIDNRHPEQGFVIVWETTDRNRIVARLFNLSGRPSTPEISISDSPGAAPSVIATVPEIIISPSGTAPSVITSRCGFFVVWMESHDTAIIMGRPYQVTIT